MSRPKDEQSVCVEVERTAHVQRNIDRLNTLHSVYECITMACYPQQMLTSEHCTQTTFKQCACELISWCSDVRAYDNLFATQLWPCVQVSKKKKKQKKQQTTQKQTNRKWHCHTVGYKRLENNLKIHIYSESIKQKALHSLCRAL